MIDFESLKENDIFILEIISFIRNFNELARWTVGAPHNQTINFHWPCALCIVNEFTTIFLIVQKPKQLTHEFTTINKRTVYVESCFSFFLSLRPSPIRKKITHWHFPNGNRTEKFELHMQIVIAITRTINFDDWLTNSDLITMKYSQTDLRQWPNRTNGTLLFYLEIVNGSHWIFHLHFVIVAIYPLLWAVLYPYSVWWAVAHFCQEITQTNLEQQTLHYLELVFNMPYWHKFLCAKSSIAAFWVCLCACVYGSPIQWRELRQTIRFVKLSKIESGGDCCSTNIRQLTAIALQYISFSHKCSLNFCGMLRFLFNLIYQQ